MNWDFLQRYDESWIWRCEDGRHVQESRRNFAALDECLEDATRNGYVAPGSKAPKRSAPPVEQRARRGKL